MFAQQWRAFTDMLERGETLGIAVSNYCPCHLDCIIDDPDLTVVPVVNQLKYATYWLHLRGSHASG